MGIDDRRTEKKREARKREKEARSEEAWGGKMGEQSDGEEEGKFFFPPPTVLPCRLSRKSKEMREGAF